MRAVWSLWTKPLRERPQGAWLSERHHWLSWILSVETARRHYPRLSLVTDDAGAKILVDGLGLKFDSVSMELNGMEHHDPRWWALGKLYAYRAQQEPFVHVDADVYLWKQLPESLMASPVFAQSPEPIENFSYYPDKFKRLARSGAWIPDELAWSMDTGQPKIAVCCGILGGSDMDLIHHYASNAIRLVEEPPNTGLWLVEEPDNMLVEQYFLAICVEYRRRDILSSVNPPHIAYLFDHEYEPFDPIAARRVGYTHLISRAKQNLYLLDLLERRVRNDFPSLYQRCGHYCSNS